MPLVPGTKLGPYEIVSPLGAGGMGEVYRAKDTRLERAVAIKILPEQLSKDPVRKQRFEREAKTISSLNHPNICTLRESGSQNGVDYLVMECLEGETLAKRLEEGALPLEQVLRFGTQIADALDKAHRAGQPERNWDRMKPSRKRQRQPDHRHHWRSAHWGGRLPVGQLRDTVKLALDSAQQTTCRERSQCARAQGRRFSDGLAPTISEARILCLPGEHHRRHFRQFCLSTLANPH